MTSLRSKVVTFTRTASSLQCGQDLELVKQELSRLNTEVQSSTSEIMKPNKSSTTVTQILPVTLFYLCPVLELQRLNKWDDMIPNL